MSGCSCSVGSGSTSSRSVCGFFSFSNPGTHVVAPPSSLVKCLWEVFVWGFWVLFLSCVCVSGPGVLFSVGVCVCVCVTC